MSDYQNLYVRRTKLDDIKTNEIDAINKIVDANLDVGEVAASFFNDVEIINGSAVSTKEEGGPIGAIFAIGTPKYDSEGNVVRGGYQILATHEDVLNVNDNLESLTEELFANIDFHYTEVVVDNITTKVYDYMEILSPYLATPKLVIGGTNYDTNKNAVLQVVGNISATENIFTNLRVPQAVPTNPTSDEYYFYVGEIGTGAITPEVSGSGTLVQLSEQIQANNIQNYGVLNIQNYTEDVPSGEFSVSLSGHRHTVADIHDIADNYLKLSGGTLTSTSVPLTINRIWGGYSTISYLIDGVQKGLLGFDVNGNLIVSPNRETSSEYYNVIHSGNVGDYAVKVNNRISMESGSLNEIGYSVTELGFPVAGAVIKAGIENYQMLLHGRNGALRFNTVEAGTLTDWKTIAFTDSNVASATKLQTARTIWGKSFDGTKDVSGNLHLSAQKLYWYDDATNYFIDMYYDNVSSPYLRLNAYGGIRMYIASLERMRITTNGNVLIGTAEDNGAKLQVAGNISSNGNLVAHAGNIMEVMGYTPPSGDDLGHRFIMDIISSELIESTDFYGVTAEFDETITAKENIFTNLRVPKVVPESPTAEEYYFYVADIGSGASTPEEVYQYSITQIADTSSLGANIREAYQLVKANGEVVGDTIKIYKDSALQSVTAENGVIKFNYLTTSGDSSTIELPLKDLITETIAGNGISIDANTNILSVDIEGGNDNPYLGFNENGALYLKGGIMMAGDGLVEVRNESGVVTALRHAYLAGNSETTEDTTDVKVGQIITGVTRDRFGHIKSITTKNLSEVFKADTSLGDNDYAVTVTVGEDGSVKFKVTINEIDGGTF